MQRYLSMMKAARDDLYIFCTR